MSKRNGGGPTREEIQNLIDGFEKQAQEAQRELEAADQALSDWKRAQIEAQRAEAASKSGALPRAGQFMLDSASENQDRHHLEYMRGRAVGKLADLQRRISLLEKAKSMTPQ